MKQVSTIIFVVAFLVWAWLEFVARTPQEGIQDILFWIGMAALLANGWDGNRRRAAI
ncbi:MAG: hypothetical protein FD125_2670 [bacterium]|nr:MAG: hypothetical protein FD125_2670 [bacterium]